MCMIIDKMDFSSFSGYILVVAYNYWEFMLAITNTDCSNFSTLTLSGNLGICHFWVITVILALWISLMYGFVYDFLNTKGHDLTMTMTQSKTLVLWLLLNCFWDI